MKINSIEKQFRGILVFSGLFNIIFASPLLIPEISNYYLFFISSLNDALHLGGMAFSLPSNPVHSLLINTAGIDLVLIGVVVLICSSNPMKHRKIILANAIGRTIFFGVVLYYVIVHDLLRIVLVFGVIDLIISCLFLVYTQRMKRGFEK